MASSADVENAITTLIIGSFPSKDGRPYYGGHAFRIYRGYPSQKNLTRERSVEIGHITVTSARSEQKIDTTWLHDDYVISRANTLSATVEGNEISFGGTTSPYTAIYLRIDGGEFSYYSESALSSNEVAGAVAEVILKTRPAWTAQSSVIVPSACSIVVRVSPQSSLISELARFKGQFMVTAYSTDEDTRQSISSLIQVIFSKPQFVILPDMTSAYISLQGQLNDDQGEAAGWLRSNLSLQAVYSLTAVTPGSTMLAGTLVENKNITLI